MNLNEQKEERVRGRYIALVHRYRLPKFASSPDRCIAYAKFLMDRYIAEPLAGQLQLKVPSLYFPRICLPRRSFGREVNLMTLPIVTQVYILTTRPRTKNTDSLLQVAQFGSSSAAGA